MIKGKIIIKNKEQGPEVCNNHCILSLDSGYNDPKSHLWYFQKSIIIFLLLIFISRPIRLVCELDFENFVKS